MNSTLHAHTNTHSETETVRDTETQRKVFSALSARKSNPSAWDTVENLGDGESMLGAMDKPALKA